MDTLITQLYDGYECLVVYKGGNDVNIILTFLRSKNVKALILYKFDPQFIGNNCNIVREFGDRIYFPGSQLIQPKKGKSTLIVPIEVIPIGCLVFYDVSDLDDENALKEASSTLSTDTNSYYILIRAKLSLPIGEGFIQYGFDESTKLILSKTTTIDEQVIQNKGGLGSIVQSQGIPSYPIIINPDNEQWKPIGTDCTENVKIVPEVSPFAPLTTGRAFVSIKPSKPVPSLPPTQITRFRAEHKFHPTIINWVESLQKYSGSNWDKEFRQYIFQWMNQITGNQELASLLVNDTNFEIWKQAFTDQTYDIMNNFEQLEIIGDIAAKLAFVKYLIALHPDISPSHITNYSHYYMAASFQSELSRVLGFPKWLRSKTSENVKIDEDLFESFCGALDKVAGITEVYLFTNKNYELAYICSPHKLVYNFINLIFSNFTLDDTKAQGSSKTILLEIGRALGWNIESQNRDIIYTNAPKFPYTTKITLSRHAIQSLAQHGFYNIPNEIGVGEGNTKEEADNNASITALRFLESKGMDSSWRRKIKDEASFSNVDQVLYNNALQKAKTQGFAKLFIYFPQNTRYGDKMTGIFQGFSKDNRPQNLGVLEGTNQKVIKDQLLRDYLKK